MAMANLMMESFSSNHLFRGGLGNNSKLGWNSSRGVGKNFGNINNQCVGLESRSWQKNGNLIPGEEGGISSFEYLFFSAQIKFPFIT